MEINVLSLKQPWASLVAWGLKSLETRSWATKYRGPLFIHASASKNKTDAQICKQYPFSSFLVEDEYEKLPYGKIIACTNLKDVITSEEALTKPKLFSDFCADPTLSVEFAFGNYSENRQIWILEKTMKLPEAIAAKGQLGIWKFNAPEHFQQYIDQVVANENTKSVLYQG